MYRLQLLVVFNIGLCIPTIKSVSGALNVNEQPDASRINQDSIWGRFFNRGFHNNSSATEKDIGPMRSLFGMCSTADLNYPGLVKNGTHRYSNGMTFTPTCEAGYMLTKPNATLICRGIKWEGDIPPCTKEITCEHLTAPQHGFVFLTRGFTKVNSVAIYSCDENHTLVGYSMRKCLSTGHWAFEAPKCLRQCTIPFIMGGKLGKYEFRMERKREKLVEKGIFVPTDIGEEVDPGEELFLQCDNGYIIGRKEKTEDIVVCEDKTWSQDLECVPIIAAGDEKDGSNERNFPKIKPNFESGDVPVTPISSLPTTEGEIKELELPEVPQVLEDRRGATDHRTCSCTYQNSDSEVVAFYEGHQLKYGDKVNLGGSVKFHCRELGYKRLHGSAEMLCRSCKTWPEHEYPICMFPEPGDTSISMDETKSKILPGGIVGIQEGDTVEFPCYGNNIYDTPKWYYRGSSMPPRITISRYRLTDFKAVSMRIDRASVEHDGTYQCGIPSRRRNLLKVKVLGITCPDLRNFVGLTISYSDGHRVGSKATFRCRPPRTLIGPSEIKCEGNGTWSSSLPSCEIYEEPLSKEEDQIIPDIVVRNPSSEGDISENTRRNPLPASATREGAGPDSAETSRTRENNKGTTDHLACSCTYNNPNFEILASSDGQILKFGDEVQIGHSVIFDCRGRNLQGPSEILCRSCEEWLPQDYPTCQNALFGTMCPYLGKIEGMKISYSNGRQTGSRAMFECTPPGTLTGPSERRCRKDGRWSKSMPSCQKSTCPSIDVIEGMNISFSDGLHVESIATFDCLPPLKRIGSLQVRCKTDGSWDGPFPFCSLPECSIESLFDVVPENVVPQAEDITSEFIAYDSTLRLNCENGLKMMGNSIARCTRQGRWEIGAIQCIQGCNRFQRPPSSEIMIEPERDFYRFGEFVIFSCPSGLTLTPNVQRVMCLGSVWTEEELPDCKEIS